MITNFKDEDTENVFNGIASKKLPIDIQAAGNRKIRQLNAASKISDMAVPPGNRLEKLHGDGEGQHSVRNKRPMETLFLLQRRRRLVV